MSSSINDSTSPKRRLSLFSFGNKKSSKKDNNNNNNSINNPIPPPSSSQHDDDDDDDDDDMEVKDKDPHQDDHDHDIQLMSPNSPLSLTDENLKNLNNINTLPPPSISSSMYQHQHQQQQQQQQPSNNQQPRLHSDTMSESSLIFERYVQDPFPTSPLYVPPQQQQQQSPFDQQVPPPFGQRQNSQFMGATHLTNENFIPLAIDSTTTLIQSNTNLDEIDMIYSPRRSSVLNLSSAFANSPQQPLSRRSSVATNYNKSPTLERSTSLFITSTQQQQQQPRPPVLRERKSTISFLSYADMIQNEEQDQNIPRRPSMSQTLSSSFLASPNHGARPRNDSLSSRTPLRQPAMFQNSPSISRQTSARNSLLNKLNTQQQQQQQQLPPPQKFQFAPDSPTSESSDNDELMLRKPKSRTLSTSSSIHHSQTNNTTSSQTIDDVLEESPQAHEIVVSSVGDTLRQYSQDIRSS